MKRTLLLTVMLLSIFSVHAQMRYLKGTLSGAAEVPPVTTSASGVVIVRYNTVTNNLQLYGDYQNLSANISSAHIHGPAGPGSTADVLFPLTHSGGTSGTLMLNTTITDAQEANLLAGMWYVNVHSTAHPTGEIRAQLTTTTDGQSNFLNARLHGSQEVPPNPSTATGNAYVLLDRFTNMVYMTGSYSGLSAAISGSHIHVANAGQNGDVLVGLTNSGGTMGTLHIETSVTDAQETSLITSGTYVNVHTSTYPGGEIRGQLTNYSQLTFFGGALSGANERPTPVTSDAKGTVIVRYNQETNQLDLTGDYQSLSAVITAAHIHGPATPDTTAGVIFTLTNSGGTTGTLMFNTTITDAQEAELLAGQWYVNVHNTTYPGGEIRAQLMSTTSGNTQYFNGNLQGDQEVPSSGSLGSGQVTAILDIITGQVYLTGTFSGLGSNATAAHIHQAPTGTSGGVILPLSVPASVSGTVTGSGMLTPAQVNAMANGNAYVNIHSAGVSSGELRAQLGNLVLPLKLLAFNVFKEREGVTITWTSAQESNLLAYDIEQQDAATKKWLKKGTVTAKGGSEKNTYSFSDVPSVNGSAVVLYRLKIREADGKVSYSYVVKLNYKTGKGVLTVLSNPVRNDVLQFSLTGRPVAEKAEATVIDHNGRVVIRTLAATAGNNEINIGHLASGMYRLVIVMNKEVLQQSFVK